MTRRISLTLLAVAAALSTACKDKPTGQVSRCVDGQNNVVGDARCDQPQVHYGPIIYPYYRWYYGGGGYAVGQTATGGSFEPAPDLSVFRASSPEGSAIVRGGFGQGFAGEVGS